LAFREPLVFWTIQKAANPANDLFVPLAHAKAVESLPLAWVATDASTFGAVAGYYLGHYASEEI